ncbi:28398_t:CDS:1, partial [Gigaspora margarita]
NPEITPKSTTNSPKQNVSNDVSKSHRNRHTTQAPVTVAPQLTTLQITTPQATTSQNTTPQATSSQITTPQATTSQIMIPL